MTNPTLHGQVPEAMRLAQELDAVPETGADPQTIQEAAAELRRLPAENEALQAGYAAARLEIESLQARIKTMAEEHADELMVAHLDGRMWAEQVMFNGLTEEETMATASCIGLMTEPAGEYPALPEPDRVMEDWSIGGVLVDYFTTDQMRAYADATCAMRAAQQPDTAYAASVPVSGGAA